jgi:hypothetical protein
LKNHVIKKITDKSKSKVDDVLEKQHYVGGYMGTERLSGNCIAARN